MKGYFQWYESLILNFTGIKQHRTVFKKYLIATLPYLFPIYVQMKKKLIF